MSIIVTQINKDGIVFGTDSNITTNTAVDREDKKIFVIPKLNAAMCTAGSYTINGELLSDWLPRYINENSNKYSSIEGFVKLLSSELTKTMLPVEKKELFISHISGYQDGHPEMWCLSNTTLEEDGKYSSGKDTFHDSEDFWSRDYKNNNLEEAFKSDGLNYQVYVNAIQHGRIAFNVVRGYLDIFFASLWSMNNFNFRHPQNIEEHKYLVRLYIEAISTAYILSDYQPKIIGGHTQLFIIKKPISK